MFLAGDSILRLKDSGELKVLIRKSQETVGDKQNKTGVGCKAVIMEGRDRSRRTQEYARQPEDLVQS